MFHGTDDNADWYIQDDRMIKPGCMTTQGNYGKQDVFYALADPLVFTNKGKSAASARVTEGNKFKPYPFGKKHGPNKGCCAIVQAWNAWRIDELGFIIYITPVHCALMEVQLSTDFMVRTYCGYTGFHNPCNAVYWDTQKFIDRRDEFRRAGGRPPMKPRLALETYPVNYGGIPAKARPPLPTAKAPPPPPKSDSESEWGPWSGTKNEELSAMEVDESVPATSAGEPQGDLPAEEAGDPVPVSWQELQQNIWNNSAGKVELQDLEVGFASRPDLLFESAEKQFETAQLALFSEREEKLLPLPENNADGTALPFKDQPIGDVVWYEPELCFFDDDDDNEEQVIEGNDGFQRVEEEEDDALHFQSDDFTGYVGDICTIRNDWNIKGNGRISGSGVLSLQKGDSVVLSYPLATDLSDERAHNFTEDEFQHYAIGA